VGVILENNMTDLTAFFKEECILIDAKIESIFKEVGDLPMYHMLRYFMGFENDLRKPTEGIHGKRTRSALLLLVADMFGGAKSAIELAAGIELFHNFTLIHDDIVDNDEMRRGQPTVWKLWGVDHGINTGDAQLLLTNQCLLRAFQTDPVNGGAGALLLNKHFQEVVEGQYLDFELTKKKLDDAEVTEEAYLEMIRKKTAVLVGVAAAAGGKSTGCTDEVAEKLFAYGEALGLAYQIVDDFVSVWGEVHKTGKHAYGDILERKKTYPVLYTRDHGNKKRLVELYEKEGVLTDADVREVLALFEEAGAREATQAFIQLHVKKARNAVQSLPLDDSAKETLTTLVEMRVTGANIVKKGTV
jgi:geranylgeranyl pyrophosphate synthase